MLFGDPWFSLPQRKQWMALVAESVFRVNCDLYIYTILLILGQITVFTCLQCLPIVAL